MILVGILRSIIEDKTGFMVGSPLQDYKIFYIMSIGLCEAVHSKLEIPTVLENLYNMTIDLHETHVGGIDHIFLRHSKL